MSADQDGRRATTPTSAALSTIVPSVATVVRWREVVACSISAAGVSSAQPSERKDSTTFPSVLTPIRTIAVSWSGPLAGSLPSRACPVRMRTAEARLRSVAGMPAYAGPARADVTPGATSKAMPASASAAASSPPRPNKKRIAALEPDNALPTTRPLNQQLIDLLLQMLAAARRMLAYVDKLSAGPRLSQQRGIDQPVKDNDIGATEQSRAPDGDQAGIAGPRANKVDDAALSHRRRPSESR